MPRGERETGAYGFLLKHRLVCRRAGRQSLGIGVQPCCRVHRVIAGGELEIVRRLFNRHELGEPAACLEYLPFDV